MDYKLKNIIEIIKNRTNSLDKTNKVILLATLVLFLIAKITSLFNFNIPGLNIIPTALILSIIGFNIIKANKEKSTYNIKSKIYLIFGSILTGFSLLIFGCIAIVYPFVILGAILL